jgi:WD40 repeat protein
MVLIVSVQQRQRSLKNFLLTKTSTTWLPKMKVIQLCAPFFLLLFLSATKSLEHEKSFLLQDGAIKIYSISLYRDSLLITSSNHIIQKDIETGILQRTFRAHEKPIRSFIIMNDSKMITSGWDDMIIVWDLESGSVVKRILLRSFKTMVSGISLWNNQLFAGGQDKAVRQVDLMTGKVVRTTCK